MSTRLKKIKLLEDIRAGRVKINDLVEPKCYILNWGTIKRFNPDPGRPEKKELTVDQFCKIFRPDRDQLFKITSGMPEKGLKVDPSGSVLAKIINHYPELNTQDNREYIEYCTNLEKVWIDKLGWELFYKYQS